MTFKCVDDIAREYLRLASTISAVPSVSFVEISGAYCSRCGGGPATRMRMDKGGEARPRWSLLCATCHRPWEGRDTQIFRGEIQSSVRGDPEGRFSVMHSLRRVVEPKPKGVATKVWNQAVLALLAYISIAPSVPMVVEWGKENRKGYAWNESTVKRRIALARREIEARSGHLLGGDDERPSVERQ